MSKCKRYNYKEKKQEGERYDPEGKTLPQLNKSAGFKPRYSQLEKIEDSAIFRIYLLPYQMQLRLECLVQSETDGKFGRSIYCVQLANVKAFMVVGNHTW